MTHGTHFMKSKYSRLAGTLALLLHVIGISAAAPIELGVKGRSNATPSIAADRDLVAIAWGASTTAGATDIVAAVSRDGGKTFGPPVRVNDVEGEARVNGEQPPRVAVRGTTITIVWTAKGVNGTKLLQARSADAGVTYSKAAAVPGTDAAGNRGWENATADAGGRVLTVWLDHRELASQDGTMAASHHEHAAQKPDGVAMAQRSKLYLASLDGSIAPRAITGGVCYCCKTAIATAADGSIFTAWRHVYPGNIRDIAFAASRDGGKSFVAPIRVSEDKWVLEGCPDDGPAMAVDGRNRIHIVWPTLITEGGADPTIALFYANSPDGKRFSPRQRIPTEGMPHHPQIAVGANGSLTIAWDEGANGKRRAAISRTMVDAAGRSALVRSDLSEGAVYPVVTATADGPVVAWTAAAGPGSVIRVARIE
jgi:hypothetical protein